MTTVLTLGTFDVLHVGHLELFRWCRRYADQDGRGRVIVAVNPDRFIEEYKGRRPLMTLEERLELISSLRDVDAAIVNYGGADAKPVISAVAPNDIVVGADWQDVDYLGQLGVTKEWLRTRRPLVIVRYVPRTRGRSSSALRANARAMMNTPIIENGPLSLVRGSVEVSGSQGS